MTVTHPSWKNARNSEGWGSTVIHIDSLFCCHSSLSKIFQIWHLAQFSGCRWLSIFCHFSGLRWSYSQSIVMWSQRSAYWWKAHVSVQLSTQTENWHVPFSRRSQQVSLCAPADCQPFSDSRHQRGLSLLSLWHNFSWLHSSEHQTSQFRGPTARELEATGE